MCDEKAIKDFFRFLKNHDAYDIYMASIGCYFKFRFCNGRIVPTDFLGGAFAWNIVERRYGLPSCFWQNLNHKWLKICITNKY